MEGRVAAGCGARCVAPAAWHARRGVRPDAGTPEGILAGDPQGTWVLQGWMFVYDAKFWTSDAVAAFLRGVPNNRMLILDYANDLAPSLKGKYAPSQWKVRQAFFGKQWINGMAHTFGGNNNVKGLALMASEPAAVRPSVPPAVPDLVAEAKSLLQDTRISPAS